MTLRIGFTVAVVVTVVACGGPRDEVGLRQSGVPQPNAVEAAYTVDTTTMRLSLELPSQLYVERDAAVVARAQGTVDSLFVELGDHVASGQLMARLESTEQEIALASAEAAYDNLTRVAGRARALVKSGGTTVADSEQVEFQLRQAEIARRKTRHDLELTRVTAPFEGIVTMRAVRPRRYVAVGETLFRVTERMPLFARVRIPEASAANVRVGQQALIIGSNGDRTVATIVHTAPIIDAASGTREAVLRLTGESPRLLAGANVMVQLASESRRIVTVPRAALAPEGYVLVIDHGRTTVRPITVGRDLGNGLVEVVSGVAPGERLARPGR